MRRDKTIHFADRRVGYYGEGCWRQRGRAFVKRLEHRHNRRVARAMERAP